MYRRTSPSFAAMLVIFLITALLSQAAFAEDATNTSTVEYRVQPLREKLAELTDSDISEACKRLSDVPGHWASTNIGKLTSLGVINGMPDGTFRPNRAISADEYITLVVRALGYKLEQEEAYWAQVFIDKAIEDKITDEDEITDYKSPLVRELAAKILVKAVMMFETAPNSNIYNYIRGQIKDYPDISDDKKQYVLQAYAMGLFGGSPQGFFNPDSNITRAEASTIIIRLLDCEERRPMKPDESEVLVITDSWGKTYEIYPTDKLELFQTAVVLNNCISKTKGYGVMDYNPYDQIVSASFFESKEAFEESDFNVQLGFSIYPMGEEIISHPYSITVFVPDRVKELHMGFVSAVFKNLFVFDII